MAISSPINIGNISKGVNSLKVGLGRVKASAQGIKSILFKKTKVKQQAITGKKILQKRRRENILRKDQEDLLEASGIKPTFRRTRTYWATKMTTMWIRWTSPLPLDMVPPPSGEVSAGRPT
jgi:hypothetical protein